MPRELEPYDRDDFRNALIANAAAKPFNLAVLVGTMGAGVVVGGPIAVCLLVALVLYAVACVRTFFDAEEADRMLGRARAERRERLERGARRLGPAALAPPVRRHL